jgi:2,3-bisphosphoglycerate-dependent phosphoglycerate mutase
MDTSHHATKDKKRQPVALKKHTGVKKGPAKGILVLVRHAESEWNVLGKWTGRTDVHLTEKGRHEAGLLGKMLADIELHHAYTSEQIRTVETLTHLLATIGKAIVPQERSPHLNERDYGDYTGLNKWEVLEQLGEDVFTKIRRSWDHPIPNGETLEMVHARAVPFYKASILPKLLAGKNVIVVSHGNTIRSLIKYLEGINNEGIAEVEMPFGEILLYHVTQDGRLHDKKMRHIGIKLPHA